MTEKHKHSSAGEHEKSKHHSHKENSSQTVTLSREEHEALLSKISELEGLRDKMLRTVADFENSKKRLTREREEFVRYAQESLIRDLLGILDNFERALDHAADVQDPKAKGIVTGVQMVFKQMNEILKNQGLVRLETVGKKFNPHVHEAVAHVTGEGPEDIIVDEIQPGYELHGKLLRAAKVRVRTAPSGEKEEELT